MNRSHQFIWWVVFLALVGIATALAYRLGQANIKLNSPTPGYYSVSRFVDGDTIDVNMDGKTETVRFIGIDTPETHKPNTPVQCFGPEAANKTKNIIGSQKVRLQADSLDTNRDRYGRLLRYVYLADGTLVDKVLIEQGYGFAYTQFPFEKSEEFKSAEEYAKTTKKGLWASCEVKTESNGREQTNPL